MRKLITKQVRGLPSTGSYQLDKTLDRLRTLINEQLSIRERNIQYNLDVTGTNWATSEAVGIPYIVLDQAKNEVWRLKFNISGTLSTAAASITITIDGIAFKFTQAVAHSDGDSTDNIQKGEAITNTGTIIGESSGTTTAKYFSGDVVLKQRPTWA